MKLLFDQNLSFKLCDLLADVFPNSNHVRMLGLERADDQAVWRYAAAHGYTLVSFDSDFAEMTAVLGSPPQVIWLRCGNQSTAVIAEILHNRADTIAAFIGGAAACLEIY